VLIITQVLQKWTQMPMFGRELHSMTVKSMVRNNIKRTLMTSRNMEPSKKMLPTLDYHMLQLLFSLMLKIMQEDGEFQQLVPLKQQVPQVQSLSMQLQVSHI